MVLNGILLPFCQGRWYFRYLIPDPVVPIKRPCMQLNLCNFISEREVLTTIASM